MKTPENIHIDKRHWEIVKNILTQWPYTFYVFGSRAQSNTRLLSDLDICFTDAIPWNIQAHIQEAFEESDLPFAVDLVDFNLCDDTFKKIIQKNWILVQKQP